VFKLDLLADVFWTPADQIPQTAPEWAGNQRHFESLREAVRFAMEELTVADRANIWITTENGNLTIEQIEQLYGSLDERQ
jgi:hypothetical protein